jgi:hypothetical protein
VSAVVNTVFPERASPVTPRRSDGWINWLDASHSNCAAEPARWAISVRKGTSGGTLGRGAVQAKVGPQRRPRKFKRSCRGSDRRRRGRARIGLVRVNRSLLRAKRCTGHGALD